MVGLDTNVLFYANDPRSPGKRQRARDLIMRSIRARSVVAQQVLGEFVHAARKLPNLETDVVVGLVSDMRDVFDVVASSPQDFDAGIGAHLEHGLPFWDALIWATVRSAGCRWLLTEDYQDGRTLGGVTFVNPFAPDNDALVDRILPPVPVA